MVLQSSCKEVNFQFYALETNIWGWIDYQENAFDAGKQFAQNYSRGMGLDLGADKTLLGPSNKQRLTKAVEETFKLSGLSIIAQPETWKRLGSALKFPSESLAVRRILQPFL